MVKEKIIKWLQKLGIKIVFNPALTLFGMVTVSAGNITINPDKWGKKEEGNIADILQKTINASLEEYRELLKEEIKGKTEKEIESLFKNIIEQYKEKFEEITRLIRENPILTLDEFKERTEIQNLLKYKFVGREAELEELHNFLSNTNEKIRVIVGEGGVGKTRLAVEFAKQLEEMNEWNIYFIHPYKNFSPIPVERKTLFILDEQSRYSDRDKLVDFVLNPPSKEGDMKLLLLDRPIFKDAIKRDLKEKSVSIEVTEIGKGNIVEFLKENLGIEERKAVKIEEMCKNSFVYALFFAEYLRGRGKVAELQKVLAERVEKYIHDIAKVRKEMNEKDIRDIIDLISLITPIDWDNDKNHLKGELPSHQYDALEKITNLSPSDILISVYNKYEIKPDPIADYLRLELIKSGEFRRLIEKLLPYMPRRIFYNVFVIRKFNEKITSKILSEIWKALNKINMKTAEYFEALVLFTGTSRNYPFFDMKKANINKWIDSYKRLSKTDSEREIRGNLSRSLVNAILNYGEAHDLLSMGNCLDELRKLYTNNQGEEEMKEHFASGLINAIINYGEAHDSRRLESCLDELRKLYEANQEDKEVREKFASGLINLVTDYGEVYDFRRLESCLDELRKLYEANPEDKKVREKFYVSLVIMVGFYAKVNDFPNMWKYVDELVTLYEMNLEDREIREKLAGGLLIATFSYLNSGKECYDYLLLFYKLRFDLPDDENKQGIIKNIEIPLVESTIKTVESEYNKGLEHLKEFILNIKSVLGENDLVSLMSKVVEKLPNVEKIIWELLDL